MKLTILAAITIGIVFSCKSQMKQEVEKDYKIIYEDGIYVEKFDSTNTSDNRYTENNKTYLEGNKLTYDYYYQNLKGEKYKFQVTEDAGNLDFKDRVKAWFFVSIDSLNDETIDKIELTVNFGLEPMINSIPDYNQTVISYQYPQANGINKFSSSTGVIENEMNVWIHPPRSKLFRILEINPFPFIQTPYEVGNKWEWSLKIGSFWGDDRWKSWEGSIENKYQYEITDKKIIDTQIGQFECYEIRSKATSSIGKTNLTAYFNLDIGFVKLDYTNIDSTKLVLEIVKFEKK